MGSFDVFEVRRPVEGGYVLCDKLGAGAASASRTLFYEDSLAVEAVVRMMSSTAGAGASGPSSSSTTSLKMGGSSAKLKGE